MATQLSSEQLDQERKRKQAYEYLCHLEEAKVWMESVLKKELGLSSELENNLRNGVDLALLATKIAPDKFKENKIYDIDLKRFEDKGLHFKYTDNIMFFIRACAHVGLPKIFLPETLDLYDAKNTPKVIFCIHALAHFLAKKGVLPLISNLYGQIEFGEHEISKIQKLLEKSGMRMPQFSKIGGMLAGELTEDDVAIHAAIMLISEALDKNDLELFIERLKSPVLNFLRIRNDNTADYLERMRDRKNKKIEVSELKAKDGVTSDDVYDKILTRAEIQDTINTVNIEKLLIEINKNLENDEKNKLINNFTDDFVFINYNPINNEKYADYLYEYYKKQPKTIDLEDIKIVITKVNETETVNRIIRDWCTKINDVIEKGDLEQIGGLLRRLPEKFNKFSQINEELVLNYLKDKKLDTNNAEHELNIARLLCLIDFCLDNNDDKTLIQCLKDESMKIEADREISIKYLEALKRLRENKGSPLLYDDIKNVVNDVNKQVTDEQNKFEIVSKINDGIGKINADELYDLLIHPHGKFNNVIAENKHAYYHGLLLLKQEQPTLWHNHIQDCIDLYNPIMSKTRHEIGLITKINENIINNTELTDLNELVQGLIPECADKYSKALKSNLNMRSLDSWSGWTEYPFFNKTNQSIYFNHKNNEFKFFESPADFDSTKGYLNVSQISDIVNRVGSEYNRELYVLSHVESLVSIQNFYRTLNKYRKFKEYLNFINIQLPNIILLQNLTKSFILRFHYHNFIKFINEHQEEACTLKIFSKTILKYNFMRSKFLCYKNNLNCIIGLESLIRTFIAQNDYYNLINMTSPSLKQVYKYLHLLEPDDYDVIEEREVLRLKNLVYDKINESTEVEEEVKSRYLLIGVLINNRQSLKDLESESNKSRKKKAPRKELANISKEKVELFEKYGHVFYILQHKSEYLSRLLLRISATHSTKFMREYFLTIFNFGTTSRDEYLMLKSLRMCLDFEVTNSITSIQELSKDDPAAFKIAISFWRDIKAPTFLQQMLAEPINEIMKIKGSINVNPVEVYKQWISKLESETGKLTELPYDVEPEVALQHEEVQNQMKKNIDIIIDMSKGLRDSILSKYDFIPYGIRFFAKCVYDCLNSKFESAPEEEKMKIVANLLYYRFINPPTVSPEAFNLLKDKTEVTSEERRNLAQISSILQRASSLVLSESSHPILQPLDDFIKESANKFMQFFKMCIEVETLEQHYNINQFSDRTQFITPELKLPFNFIIETHRMLIDHADIVFPHEDDVLQNIVKEIGEVPELTSLVDYRPPKADKNMEVAAENVEEILGNAMTILPLVPPKVLLETEENKNEELLNNCINKLVDILHFSKCETISQVLLSTFTEEQEAKYRELLTKRESIVEQKAPELQTDLTDSGPSEKPGFMSLTLTLALVIEEIKVLEENHVIKSDNDYQDLLLAIVKKIVQRTQYVKSRKVEISRFRSTYDDLQTKIENLTKQLDYYNLYIKGCVTNMAQRKKSKKKNIKKAAHKLIQQGILVEIEGISPDKYKNVMVVFSTTDEPGVYEISGEFVGISVDTYKCRINFQDLLQLKFDNVAILRIMSIVKVRVNLLIRFINLNFHV